MTFGVDNPRCDYIVRYRATGEWLTWGPYRHLDPDAAIAAAAADPALDCLVDPSEDLLWCATAGARTAYGDRLDAMGMLARMEREFSARRTSRPSEEIFGVSTQELKDWARNDYLCQLVHDT